MELFFFFFLKFFFFFFERILKEKSSKLKKKNENENENEKYSYRPAAAAAVVYEREKRGDSSWNERSEPRRGLFTLSFVVVVVVVVVVAVSDFFDSDTWTVFQMFHIIGSSSSWTCVVSLKSNSSKLAWPAQQSLVIV